MSHARFDQAGFPPATISHEKSMRFLHLGSSYVQGAMNLKNVDALVLEYVQWMMIWLLFERNPRHIVQIGLGSSALTRFCHLHFPQAQVTAVEINPNVIAVCRAHFNLPPDNDHLQVLEMDGRDFVANPARHGQIDILQLDIYDENARGPALGGLDFYRDCHACMSENGILTANIFGGGQYDNIQALQQVFDAILWLPTERGENLVVLAFKKAPEIGFEQLFARARQIHEDYQLKAKAWVLALQKWMAGE